MKKLLPLNLQLFAEDNNPSDETKKPDENKEHMIPKSRFDEVNQRYKDIQAKMDQFLAEKADAEKKSQEEQGKFQELYESTSKEFSEVKSQFESVQNRAKELEGVVNSLLESKLKGIPEEFHDLIPGNLTPEGKLDWINKAEEKGLFGKQPQQPVGEMTNGGEYNGITKDQFAKMTYPERNKLFSSNPDLYKKLSR
ncbi:hypothetical protein [Cytobacillus oceanisediminis]|uniref:Uncharacterized protein n=1 Tax=Cytobacillus oceanisediminis 2691 TaxID=1196031 RepID=A0A160MA62_9BACI|nr:hypothetical protein [Cytobacillus oceanisediminis]AND39612.1 hypothetical protein A361_10845 [Cytobacillus oceanisediminis 2691]